MLLIERQRRGYGASSVGDPKTGPKGMSKPPPSHEHIREVQEDARAPELHLPLWLNGVGGHWSVDLSLSAGLTEQPWRSPVFPTLHISLTRYSDKSNLMEEGFT